MKSQVKIYKEDLADFYNYLLEIDAEVNTESVDWRAIMWRSPEENQWTQAYDGKTRSRKNERSFLRVFGPDQDLVNTFYLKKENQ